MLFNLAFPIDKVWDRPISNVLPMGHFPHNVLPMEQSRKWRITNGKFIMLVNAYTLCMRQIRVMEFKFIYIIFMSK